MDSGFSTVQNRAKNGIKTVPRENTVFLRKIKGFHKRKAQERRVINALSEGGEKKI